MGQWSILYADSRQRTLRFIRFTPKDGLRTCRKEIKSREHNPIFLFSCHITRNSIHWWRLLVLASVCVVMLLLPFLINVFLDILCWICSILEWLALEMIYPPAMEAEVRRALDEEAPEQEVPQVAKGCTSSRWLKEPGQWHCTTLNRQNRIASQ